MEFSIKHKKENTNCYDLQCDAEKCGSRMQDFYLGLCLGYHVIWLFPRSLNLFNQMILSAKNMTWLVCATIDERLPMRLCIKFEFNSHMWVSECVCARILCTFPNSKYQFCFLWLKSSFANRYRCSCAMHMQWKWQA